MLLRLADTLLLVLEILIWLRVIWSWLDRNPWSPHPVKRFLWQVTDPLIEPIRRLVPPLGGMWDLSPWLAILLLIALRGVLARAAL